MHGPQHKNLYILAHGGLHRHQGEYWGLQHQEVCASPRRGGAPGEKK